MDGRLVGRANELAVLDQALDAMREGRMRVVELVGEPGIGKTSLLDEFAARARKRGNLVLAGRAAEFERMPFGAFIDALDDHVNELGRERLVAEGHTSLDRLSVVFPALADWSRTGLAPVAGERHLVYRAVRTLLESSSEASGLVLVLDDLHWADDTTTELVDYLLRHPPQAQVLLAVAHRPRQVPARLAVALARGAQDGLVRPVPIGPLSMVEIEQLCGPGIARRQLREVYEATSGNPFYVEALVRGGMPVTPDATREVPEDGVVTELPPPVRAVLLAELDGLSSTSRLAVRAAAVLGDPFEPELVGAVAQTDSARTLVAFDELIERDLVRASGARQFRFRHPLLRHVVYLSAGAGWRLGAHARAAAGLERRGGPLAAIATHLQRAANVEEAHAVEVLVAAARESASLAPASAAQWVRTALRLLGDDTRVRPELWLLLANALTGAGHLPQSRDLLRKIIAGLPAGERELRVTALAQYAAVERLLGGPEEAADPLIAELDTLGDQPTRGSATLGLEIAAMVLRGGDFAGGVRWARHALRVTEQLPDVLPVATAASVLSMAELFAGDREAATEHVARAIALVDAADDTALTENLDAILRVGWTEVFLERGPDALRHLNRGLALARRAGHGDVLTDLLMGLAYGHLALGELSSAVEFAQDAFETALLVGSDELRTMATAVSCTVDVWRGDFVGALRASEKAVAEAGLAAGRGRTVATGMLGQARLLTGDPEGCVQAVEEAGGPDLLGFEAPLRALWYRVLTQAELARGRVEAAEEYACRAEAAADAIGLNGARGHANLAKSAVTLRTDAGQAARYAAEAVAAFERIGMRLFEGIARMAAANALAGDGQRAAALAEVSQAKALFTRCGADGLQKVADREQRRLGGRSRRAPEGTETTLTDRETQIAELVSQGSTNRRIGELLFMSPKTVEKHLSRIFTKLSVTSRSGVAAAMVKRRTAGSEGP